DRTLDQSGGQRWVAPSGAAGPFSAGISIPIDQLDAAGGVQGVQQSDAILFSRTVAEVGSKPLDVNLFGVVPGGLGAPGATRGRDPQATGELLVPKKLADIGDHVLIFGRSFEVVGTVDKASLLAGSPSVFMLLTDAQAMLTNGQNLASMIVTSGAPTGLPAQLTAFDRRQTRDDLARPLKSATQSIGFIRSLLWMVAALIVASVIYLSALERTRDFAVFKATGVTTSAIGVGLALQAIAIALTASIVGAILAVLIAPKFPMDVVISSRALLFMPVLAVIVGVVSSLVGLRRIAQVQPAVAFGGP
ncbi:MAG: glutamine transporter permease, partial [Ilumatobacteraceae bacterium]|nr:glutamine transporter permease [Ilumatobacteraceae bacterium]